MPAVRCLGPLASGHERPVGASSRLRCRRKEAIRGGSSILTIIGAIVVIIVVLKVLGLF